MQDVASEKVEQRLQGRIEYSNILARIIIKHYAEDQFLIPLDGPGIFEWFLKWYERWVLNIDLRAITVEKPIFLVGLPRSGTTLMQDILCAHPSVAYITNAMNQHPACFCAADRWRRFLKLDFRTERYLADSLEIRAGSANEGLAILPKLAQIELYSLECREVKIQEFTPQQLDEIVETVKKVIWCFGRGANRWFNKNPGFLMHVRLLQDIFPDCKIIHMVRDPRMCANSLAKLCRLNQARESAVRAKLGRAREDGGLFVPYPRVPKLTEYIATYGVDSIQTTARVWNDAISFIDQNSPQLRAFLTLRYEDLLARPQEEVQRILDFCELASVDGLMDPFRGEVEKIGIIHHKNEYANYEVIEELCHGNMMKYGYA